MKHLANLSRERLNVSSVTKDMAKQILVRSEYGS